MGGIGKFVTSTMVQQGLVKKATEQETAKSLEQPKVAAQMDAVKPADTSELAAQKDLEVKRRGRRSTILTSVSGTTEAPTLGYKSLLG